MGITVDVDKIIFVQTCTIEHKGNILRLTDLSTLRNNQIIAIYKLSKSLKNRNILARKLYKLKDIIHCFLNEE